MSEAAFGHGGSTGQSMWIDPGRGVYTIVLTNRNHEATTDNYEPSKRLRAELADLLIEALDKKPRDKSTVSLPN